MESSPWRSRVSISTTSASSTSSRSAISFGSGLKPSRSSARFSRFSRKKSFRCARVWLSFTSRMLSISHFRM